jgi:hypothetical protein
LFARNPAGPIIEVRATITRPHQIVARYRQKPIELLRASQIADLNVNRRDA